MWSFHQEHFYMKHSTNERLVLQVILIQEQMSKNRMIVEQDRNGLMPNVRSQAPVEILAAVEVIHNISQLAAYCVHFVMHD